MLEGIVALVAIVLAAIMGGRYIGSQAQKEKHRNEKANEYNNTSKKLDEVRPSSSADAARQRMRDRRKP